MSDIAADAKAWFADNWDADLTLGEWWERLGRSGYGFPTWPANAFGLGATGDEARAINDVRVEAGAFGPPSGIGPMMAGPTVAEHGMPEQIQRLLPGLVTGRHIWCQLFSEPGSGSDLASLQTRAVRDGDEWIVNGQKVWTSGAQYSKWGILIARTNADVPKHEGITYFVIDMEQPGVEVRPLKEMTGGATFNEVFFSDARVPHDNVIGDVDRGWSVAVTTLSHERKNLGGGGIGAMAGGGAMLGISVGGEGGGPATPDLSGRVGDLVGAGGGMGAMASMGAEMFRFIPAMFGKNRDALVRQDIARLYTLMEITRYTGLRSKAAAEMGQAPGPEMSTGKLMISNLMRTMRDFMLRLEGPSGMLAGADAPMNGMAQWIALFSPAISIAGGTDEIQRNIIGERVLGLPPEPRPDKDAPFKDLLVGTQR
ncbi:MAG: acyl-CoA dehydrogenase family protein [Actinobacteria bacterium]|nr:acyl-CoA dehydrogenase family protein [Actinomycetota bacterium]